MRSQNVLGFDFGTKYLGIAVGQQVTQTARPLTTIKMLAGKPNWQLLDPLIQEWQPMGLVVGLALQPDGSHSKTSLLAEQFGHALRERYNLPLYFIEERLTSVAARTSFRNKKASKLPEKQEIDRISAAIILESWLNTNLSK